MHGHSRRLGKTERVMMDGKMLPEDSGDGAASQFTPYWYCGQLPVCMQALDVCGMAGLG